MPDCFRGKAKFPLVSHPSRHIIAHPPGTPNLEVSNSKLAAKRGEALTAQKSQLVSYVQLLFGAVVIVLCVAFGIVF